MKDLDDAKRELTRVLNAAREGDDIKQLQTEISAIKAFAEVYVSQIKNDPKEEAKREFARGVARKAAESIDIQKAKDILKHRNFLALEDEMGLISDEQRIAEGNKVIKLAVQAEKELK
jgi:hypothetical protein